MDRIPVGSLSFRAKARFSLHPEGMVIGAQGEAPVLLDAKGGIQAGLATRTIDRVVEPEGLVVIRCNLGETEVDSYLRVTETNPIVIVDAVNSMKGIAE